MDKATIFMAAPFVAIIAIAIFLYYKLFPNGKRAKKPSGKQSKVFCAIAALLLICSAVYVALAIVTSFDDAGESPPVLTSPYKEMSEAFVEAADGFLLHLSDDIYKGNNTPAKSISTQADTIYQLFEEHRMSKEPFELPVNFILKDVPPKKVYKTSDDLDGYDGQLTYMFSCLKTDCRQNVETYNHIGITAWNCLDTLGEDAGLEDCLYYAQIAFYGLANEYVFCLLDERTKVDRFYTFAQVYLHIEQYAVENAPPFKYEMYFVSAAFLDLSYSRLKNINFDDTGHKYRSAVWEHNMLVLYNLGIHLSDRDEYFKLLTACSNDVLAIPSLTAAEKAEVNRYVSNVAAWG